MEPTPSTPPAVDNLINIDSLLGDEMNPEVTIKVEEMDLEDFETDIIILNMNEEINLGNEPVGASNQFNEDHVLQNEMFAVGPEIAQTANTISEPPSGRDAGSEPNNQHQNKSCNDIPMNANANKSKEKMCKFCSKIFTKNSNLTRHQDYHCRKNEAREENNKKLKYGMFKTPFTCDYCQKSYTHKNTLKRHLRSHLSTPLPSYQCGICCKKYTKKHNLDCHMSAKHLNLKIYACRYCPRQYARRWSMKNHEKKCHKESYVE